MWVWATCCVVKCSCGHFCFADQIRICFKGNALPKLSPLFQPKGKKAKGKKVAPAPSVAKKHEAKKVVNPLFEKRPKNFGIGKFPNFNFAENISLWCAWCKRIFAILTTMITISHQDRWCISVLRAENLSLKPQSENQCLCAIFLRPGHSAQAWFDALCEMASLHPPAEAARHPLQTSEGSPCNQPVHPGSGSPDRYVSSPKDLRICL